MDKISGSNEVLHKPNGIVKYKNFIFITEKNKKCVTLYHNNNSNIQLVKRFNHVDKYAFGRLGNLEVINGKIFICDEGNKRLITFDTSNKKFSILDSSMIMIFIHSVFVKLMIHYLQ